MVSNGGWTKIGKLSDLDDNVEEDDWDPCFNINVKSYLYLFLVAKKYLSAADSSFVTNSSVAGVKPSGSSFVRWRGNLTSHMADEVRYRSLK